MCSLRVLSSLSEGGLFKELAARMPNPYSLDLRWRVVWLHLVHGATSAEIVRLLCLSGSTVRRYISMFRTTGEVKPAQRKNGPQVLLGDFEQMWLLKSIIEDPTAYIHEIQRKFREAYGVQVSASTICRTLKNMGK